jgi:DNA-binding CsgD family transcriptional regulator
MAARAMKAGAVDFLTKPFREQDMLDAVAVAIERDRIRREGVKAASGMRALFETLSPREREVMALVISGLMNKQVAAKTGLAESTVKIHRGQVMRKMGAKSLADLIKMAEMIDVHGNGFRRPSSELEVASDACASDPRSGKTAHGSIGDFAMPDSRHAVLAGQVLNAMAEIAAGRLPLAQIALNTRFSSQASFTRAFRRATGMTPAAYRLHRRGSSAQILSATPASLVQFDRNIRTI